MVCVITAMLENDSLAMWRRSITSGPSTKSWNNGIKMGDHESSKHWH